MSTSFSRRLLMTGLLGALLIPTATRAQTPSPTPAPTPTATPSASPAPTPTPVPAFSFSGVFTNYHFSTVNVNATGALDTNSGNDLASRTDISNALLTYTKNTGAFRYGITAGEYALPVVGQALNPTSERGANTELYTLVPQVYVAYAPSSNLAISVGKLATLLGQESNFTYQNVDIQRGLGWSAEPTFSRGIRATYTQGKFTGDLEYNDGFYSGSHRAVEGLAGWAPSSNTNLQFVFIVPSKDTPPNPTVSIANKAEYDLMITQNVGKFALTPYVLFISSPSNTDLGYTSTETAIAYSFIASYPFNAYFSLGARYEDFLNHSGMSDTSSNADFIGYGAGSRATTITVTPQYKIGLYYLRAEYSLVNASRFKPGLAFGTDGTIGNQTRYGLELGAQF
ncbi:MAG: outer membrane beta-barrel protein [Vulcanimicrobiaceae bacterium]